MNPWEQYGGKTQTMPWEMYAPVGVKQGTEQFGPPKPDRFKGFFERVGDDINKRAVMAGQIQAETRAGNQSKPEEILQLAGKSGAGLMNDLAGNVLISGFRALPDAIENPIREKSADVLNYITNTPVGDAARFAADKYSGFQKEHPRAARNVEAATNLGLFLAATKPHGGKDFIDTAVSGTRKAKSLVDDAADYVGQNLVRHSPQITSEQVRAIGSDLFKKAEQAGGILSPENADGFRKRVLSVLSLDDEAKLYANNPVAERLVKNIGDFSGKPMSFETAKNIDEALGELAYSTMDDFGKISAQGKKFLDLQSSIRDAMDTIPGGEVIKEARQYWKASLKMRDIERIIERAKDRPQPVTILKNGFKGLLSRGDKLKGYTPEEVRAIQKAAKTGIVTDALQLAGSGLVPISSAAVGGFPGAAVGFGVQQTSKAIGTARQMGRANKALDAVLSNSVNAPRKALTMKQIMALPPEQAKFYLSKLPAKAAASEAVKKIDDGIKLLPGPNSARPMTEAQIMAAREAINKPLSARKTPDALGDVPYNYIATPAPEKARLLPPPDKMSPLPMSEREVLFAQRGLKKAAAAGDDLSGAAPKPPVSQFTKLEATLGRKRYGEFKIASRMLLDGDLSQNQFIKEAVGRYGLSVSQARSLAKEIKTYKK